MIEPILRIFLTLLFLITLDVTWIQAENIAAHVSGIRGKAYKRGADEVTHPLKTGDQVKVGDSITTEKNSRVKLVFQDKTIVSVHPGMRFFARNRGARKI